MKSIALFYGHVARNVGDIAINLGEVALLKSVYPDAAITAVLLNARNSPYLAASKASFGPAGGVRLVEVSGNDENALDYAVDPARWLRHCEVEDADLVVLAAGEHLFSYADNDNLRGLFWRSLPAFAARLTGKRCLVMPSTFGPYETDDGKALVTQLLETQPRIAARDARSREVLRALGTAARIDTGLDPAFFIEPPTTPARSKKRAIGLVMRSEHWGIRLAAVNRAVFDDDLRERDAAYRFSLALARKVLADSDREVRMFIQTETDRPIVEAVAQALGEAGAARFRPVVVNTIEDYLAAIGEVDCVVASRFHALIFGMVRGKPGLGLYFDVHGHKIPGLMDLLERPDDCINLSQTPIEQAVEAVHARFVAQTPDFAPTARRIEALRRETRKWLAEAWMNLAKQDALTLSSSQAFLKIGAALTTAAYASQAEQDAARVAAVENSTSYRLGHALVTATRSPGNLLRLPGNIWSAYRQRNVRPPTRAEKQAELLKKKSTFEGARKQSGIRTDGVLYLMHNCLPYHTGGYAVRAHGLLRGFQAAGWSVTAQARLGYPHDRLEPAEPVPARLLVDEIEYRFLPDQASIDEADQMGYVKRYAERVLQSVDPARIGFVQAASFFQNGLAGRLIADRLGVPLVYEMRGLEWFTRGSLDPAWRRSKAGTVARDVELEAARRADHVFAITDALKSWLVEQGLPEAKVSVLPNGCNPDPAPAVASDRDELPAQLGFQGAFVVGYIGSVVFYEGIEIIIRAVAEARERSGRDIRFLLVGDGRDFDTVRRFAQESGAESFAKLVGRVPHHEVDRYYDLIDAFVLARADLDICHVISPLKPLEAMMKGKLLITSDVRAIEEMVRASDGGALLFKAGDHVELAQRILEAAENPEQMAAIADRGRNWAINERNWSVLARNALNELETRFGKAQPADGHPPA